MQKKAKYSVVFLTQTAVVAALYVGLTLLFAPFSFGSVQFRVSEILTILPIFMKSSILGLSLGCFVANMMSFSPWDMLFGTLATFIAAILTYVFRNIRCKNFNILSMLPPVIINAIIVGAEITYIFTPELASVELLVFNMLSVGVGQTVMCLFVGVPLARVVDKMGILRSVV